MLLNSVIIVLREVLEAALIISVFLAFSQMLKQPRMYLLLALSLGLLGSAIYAININLISQAFEGSGQEISDATMHLLVYGFMVLFGFAAVRSDSACCLRIMTMAMMMAIIFATVREGSEIILYITGFRPVPNLLRLVILGGAIGAGIGVSVGVFFYYLLVNLSRRNGKRLGFVMILLVASSMVSQSVQLLTQADILPGQYPMWDTSGIISEHSITGQLLFAMIGYESSPTPIQVIAYFGSLLLMIIVAGYSYKIYSRPQPKS